jgi:hypothetical protein
MKTVMSEASTQHGRNSDDSELADKDIQREYSSD